MYSAQQGRKGRARETASAAFAGQLAAHPLVPVSWGRAPRRHACPASRHRHNFSCLSLCSM